MLFEESSSAVLSSFNDGTETKIGNQLVNEAIIQDALLENDMTMLDEDTMLSLLSEELLSERSILKWDKAAKRKHATNRAAIIIAKEHNDKDYKKLVTVYKMRNKLLDRIMAKYGNKAKIRVKQNEKNGMLGRVLATIKDKAHVKKVDIDK